MQRYKKKWRVKSEEWIICCRHGFLTTETLCPKLFFLCITHRSATLRTGMAVPSADTVAAATQAQPPYFRAEGWCYVADNPTHHQILNRVAVGARDGCDVRSEESFPFVGLRLISACCASVFLFPGHLPVLLFRWINSWSKDMHYSFSCQIIYGENEYRK